MFGGAALQRDVAMALFSSGLSSGRISVNVLLYQPRQRICVCFNFSCYNTPTTLLSNVAPGYSALTHSMQLPRGKQWQSSADEILGVPDTETLAHLNK